METIPGYDNWKTRSPEDDADLHARRSRSGGINFNGVGKVTIGGSVIGGNKDEALIKELVEAIGNFIYFCEENDTIGRGIDFILLGGERFELDEMRAVLKKAKDKGYE